MFVTSLRDLYSTLVHHECSGYVRRGGGRGDDFEDIENQDEQVEPLKEKRVLDLGPFNDEDEEITKLKSGGAAEEQLKKKKVKTSFQ